jgi:hypothetical protein
MEAQRHPQILVVVAGEAEEVGVVVEHWADPVVLAS